MTAVSHAFRYKSNMSFIFVLIAYTYNIKRTAGAVLKGVDQSGYTVMIQKIFTIERIAAGSRDCFMLELIS